MKGVESKRKPFIQNPLKEYSLNHYYMPGPLLDPGAIALKMGPTLEKDDK